jgi:hypothetical protein
VLLHQIDEPPCCFRKEHRRIIHSRYEQRVKLNACLERPAAVNDLERLLRVDQALFAFFLFDTL